MNFIDDIIYGLKVDMGEQISVTQSTSAVINYQTGEKAITTSSFTIQMAIVLPKNQAVQFLRSVGIQVSGTVKSDEQVILLDKTDVPTPIQIGDVISVQSKSRTVLRIEDYPGAMILVIKELNASS